MAVVLHTKIAKKNKQKNPYKILDLLRVPRRLENTAEADKRTNNNGQQRTSQSS